MSIQVNQEEAARMRKWIAERGGIAVWTAVDLRIAGERVFTPALTTTGKPTTKPGWQYANTPSEIITDPSLIIETTEHLFAAFPVALRRSGFGYKLSDAAQRKLDKLMKRCEHLHGNSFYRKGVLPDKAASMGVYYSCSL